MKIKIITISLIFLIAWGLIFPLFSFAQQHSVSPPQNKEEIKNFIQKAIETIKEKIPLIVAKIWKEEVLPVWQKMYDWFKRNIWLKIENWFKDTLLPLLKGEFSENKPLIKEEFQKEKEEMKSDLPNVRESLWERFKDLIR
jgi:hypothetical protein